MTNDVVRFVGGSKDGDTMSPRPGGVELVFSHAYEAPDMWRPHFVREVYRYSEISDDFLTATVDRIEACSCGWLPDEPPKRRAS